jgi:hypothetical protein
VHAEPDVMDRHAHDAIAIAHAPTDVQRLLAKVDALEAELARLRGEADG